jgi:hypothetical protein
VESLKETPFIEISSCCFVQEEKGLCITCRHRELEAVLQTVIPYILGFPFGVHFFVVLLVRTLTREIGLGVI